MAVKVVCFVSAAYLKSPYCMKEIRVAQGMDKLLIVACEPVQAIRAVDPTAYPHASDALGYLMGGGQVIFHDMDDVEAEIMKFIAADAATSGMQPEPEPQPVLSPALAPAATGAAADGAAASAWPTELAELSGTRRFLAALRGSGWTPWIHSLRTSTWRMSFTTQ